MHAIGAIHKTEVVVAGSYAVPGLSCVLEVANVLVAKLEVLINIGDAAVIAAAASFRAVDETVGVGLMVGTVDDEMLPQQAC